MNYVFTNSGLNDSMVQFLSSSAKPEDDVDSDQGGLNFDDSDRNSPPISPGPTKSKRDITRIHFQVKHRLSASKQARANPLTRSALS